VMMCAEAVAVEGFTAIKIVGDGSCFWRSIVAHFEHYKFIDYLNWLANECSDGVFELFPEHWELYQEVTAAFACGYFPLDVQQVMFLKVITAVHILKNRREYQHIPLNGLTLEAWIAEFVLKYDTWADHEAIKAVADVMNINIHIHQHGRQHGRQHLTEPILIKSPGGCAYTNVDVFYSGTHYSLLLPQ
jgi:hypothetical protein